MEEDCAEIKFTMHQFRHTYATLLYYTGVDSKTSQSYLGHSFVVVAIEIYTHLDQVFKQGNVDKLNCFVECVEIGTEILS